MSKTFASYLNSVRTKNVNRTIFSHVNINSIFNNFELLADAVTGSLDALLISETKTDANFTNAQFHLEVFTPPYRLDKKMIGGGTFLYIRKEIPSKEVKNITVGIKGFIVEINIRKKK